MVRSVPIGLFDPLRRQVHRFKRGGVARNLCVLVLKHAERSFRGRLATRVSAITAMDDLSLTFEPVDSMVMDAVYWMGIQGYEGVLAAVWTDLCRRSQNVLEIGGNVGLFTVLGARATTGQYRVLEPLPGNAAVIRANLARNGVSAVVIEAAAIPGALPEPVSLSIPNEGRGAPVGAHLMLGSEVAERSSANVVTVDGRPFRDLAASCDLIKIDAEGIEAELLLSAREAIVATKPILVIEVLPESVRLAALLSELAVEAGYRLFIVPAYGQPTLVEVAPSAFVAGLPAQHRSKDVVLSRTPPFS